MKRLEVRLRSGPTEERVVGVIAEKDHRVYFEYAEEFLATGWQLSPWKLPSEPGLQEHRDRSFGRLPGVFEDSLPDGWGLLLIDRHFRRLGVDPAVLSPLDRLAYLGSRTMGALTYHPPAEVEPGELELDLQRMAEGAREVLSGSSSEVLPQLVRAGGSPAGARPKVLVGVRGEELLSGEDDLPEGFEHWLVKFAGREDRGDAGPLELAYARLAGVAGIEMPEARLFETRDGGRYFGVRRFDRRPGNLRRHVHTLGGLIHADFRIPSCDYDNLLRVARGLTRDHQAVVECFRRLVFNVVACNQDDHVKNHAFVMDERGEWSLSPAYDVVFSRGPGGEHQMSVDGEGRAPSREGCIAFAERHGLSLREAEDVIDRVEEAVAGWATVAKEAGCSEETQRTVAGAHRRLSS